MTNRTRFFPATRRTLMSYAILLALSSGCFMAQATSLIDVGAGENKTLTEDVNATRFLEDALYVHDGGSITGTGITLSSKTGTLLRAHAGGDITLTDITLKNSFGPLSSIKSGGKVRLINMSLTTNEDFYISGQDSLLSISHSLPSQTGTTFDISNNATLLLDDVQINAIPSGSGAALIRGNNHAQIIIQNAFLSAQDSAVLKLAGGSVAELTQTELSTSPTKPEEIGYYPVVRVDENSQFFATETTLRLEKEGAGLSITGGSFASMNNGLIEAKNIIDGGSGVSLTGAGSRVALQDTQIQVTAATALTPGDFTGINAGPGSVVSMTGGGVFTNGEGIAGITTDRSQLFLTSTNIHTLQDNAAGIQMFQASGEMNGTTVVTEGQNSAALVIGRSGDLKIQNSQLSAINTSTIVLDGDAQAPLTLTLVGTHIKAGLADALRVSSDINGTSSRSSSADIIVTAYDGSRIDGDVNIQRSDAGARFSLGLMNGSTLTGAVNAAGGVSALNTERGGVWNVTGNSIIGVLNHAGTINISGDAPGTVVHVRGDYLGDGGTINFNTTLGGDNSTTDSMIIDGSTRGTTSVTVANVGGMGAQTLNGIQLIRVGGDSSGEFTQVGRIVAGAYDYSLVRGQGTNVANWYLVSGETNPHVNPTPPPETAQEPWVRPESAIYTANMSAANNLFTHHLHDRLGETHYVDVLTDQQKVTSMWLRNLGGHTRSKDNAGQVSTQSNRYVMQLGGDIAQWSHDDRNRFHLGVMGGYANQKSNADNSRSGYNARGSINGYSVGMYGTWLQDNDIKTGAYIDTWLQYNWFNNQVDGESIVSERYKSKGLTSSLEAGYTWKLGDRDERSSFYVQPKTQVIWMGVKANDHKEANGTFVGSDGHGNIQTRLGVRGFIKGHSEMDDNKQRIFEPFIETNWIHNSRNFGATLNDVRVTQAGTRHIGEVKTGVEGQLNPTINLWGNVTQQISDKGYSDTSAMLGMKVSF
jgi:outer membrane autotransporter protein